MNRNPKTLLALMCSLALAGAVGAAEPDDPKADPAASHHGGGDAAKHSQMIHPVEGVGAHDHDEPGSHTHVDGPKRHCPMPTTGNPDQDYVLRLRHHHLMEVEMARTVLKTTADASIRAMAQATVDAHGAKVAELDKWLAAKGVNPDKFKMQCGTHSGMADGHVHEDGEMHVHPFDEIDRNRDGYLSHDELLDTDPLHQHFAMADTDRDGRLSRAEIDAHHAATASGAVAPRLTAAPHPAPAEAFAVMDNNKDGYLTPAELSASHTLHQHFEAADTDGDGRLSPTEVDAHHAATGVHAH